MNGNLVNKDLEHLRLLSIFHYILGGVSGLFSLFPCIHLGFGILMVTKGEEFLPAPAGPSAGPPVEVMGWLVVAVAGTIIVLGLTMSTCMIFAGRNLSQQRGYLFCLIIAGLECLSMPFGTILGVFTFVVLFRPSVRVLFGVDPPSPQPSSATPPSGPPPPSVPPAPVDPPPTSPPS